MAIQRFDGRHALVVGGAGGIGLATCRQLIREGCRVTSTAGDQQELRAFRGDPTLSEAQCEILDVRDANAASDLLKTVDRLDVLVNLAGVGAGDGEFTEEGFARTIDINLTGTMRMCLGARGLLEARGGAIVNTASMMSYFGSGTAPAYASSKGGIVQLTKSLAVAFGPSGIRVNAVAPGWISTPMTTELFADEARRARVLSRTPLQRLGRPEDVADGICYLAAPSTVFVTGVVLPVDGGYLAV